MMKTITKNGSDHGTAFPAALYTTLPAAKAKMSAAMPPAASAISLPLKRLPRMNMNSIYPAMTNGCARVCCQQ